jgi:hypothetical protein
MKLYATDDLSKSIHVAYEQFTHVILNRGYSLVKPTLFNSSTLDDLPIHQYASWIPATDRQVTMWQETGGVLIEQDPRPEIELAPDVTLMVECPYQMKRIEACCQRNAAYGVVPRPVSWAQHDETVDLRFPPVPFLQELWTVCGGQRMSNHELASELGVSVVNVQFMKTALNPKEHWHIQKRLAPEREEFIPVWDWLESKDYPRNEITKKGYRNWIEEMARFGYIQMKKIQHYPAETPNWKKLEEGRDAALMDMACVRLLVESLPDHPEALSQSGESL